MARAGKVNAAGAPCSEMHDVAQMLAHEQVQAVGMLGALPLPGALDPVPPPLAPLLAQGQAFIDGATGAMFAAASDAFRVLRGDLSETEARHKMETVRERLVNGADFAELARLYSQDGSAAKGETSAGSARVTRCLISNGRWMR